MTARFSEQTSIFGVVFFVSKTLLGIEAQKKQKVGPMKLTFFSSPIASKHSAFSLTKFQPLKLLLS